MTTSTATEQDELDAEASAPEMIEQAKRVVATYARDAAECQQFLAMLGIGPAPEKPKPKPAEPGLRCECGRAAWNGDKCHQCLTTVPVDEIREVVVRIRLATDLEPSSIAPMADVEPRHLVRIMRPASDGMRAKRTILEKLLSTEQKIAAGSISVPESPAQYVHRVQAHLDKLDAAGKTTGWIANAAQVPRRFVRDLRRSSDDRTRINKESAERLLAIDVSAAAEKS
jgi:hypothetical protein